MPGVLRARPRYDGGLRSWILEQAWSIDETLTTKRARLQLHDADAVVDACVNDFIALANAAFESATSVTVRNEPRSCAWQVISYYYAAYFAANALMRLGGYACTNFDVDVCSAINETASLYGRGGITAKEKLNPGVYFCTLNSRSVPELVAQSMEGVKGGVHIQFWHGFLKFLEAIEKGITTGPLTASDKKAAKKQLLELREVLTRTNRANGSWLSEVRNAVNYRFEKGVWFPYENSDVGGDSLKVLMRNGVQGAVWLQDVGANVPDCSRLVSASSVLLRWTRESLESLDGQARHSKRARIRDGALAFVASL